MRIIIKGDQQSECMFAVVDGDVHRLELLNPKLFVIVLREAITRWVKTSARARDIMDRHNGVITLRDLEQIGPQVTDMALLEELRKDGISNLHVKRYCWDSLVDSGMTFDSNLINEESVATA